MAQFKAAWLNHQRGRFMRPDAQRYIEPDVDRWSPRKLGQDEEKCASNLKFDPDQPRVPAGTEDGGQWTSGSQSSDADFLVPTLAAMSKNAICEAQYLTDRLICQMARNRACWAQLMVRLSACEKGQPIPPLNY